MNYLHGNYFVCISWCEILQSNSKVLCIPHWNTVFPVMGFGFEVKNGYLYFKSEKQAWSYYYYFPPKLQYLIIVIWASFKIIYSCNN